MLILNPIPKVSLEFSPAVLRAVGFPALGRRFITWRVLPPRKPGGKPVKMPCDGRWDPIDSADERNWLSFTEAVDLATRRHLGLGLALGWGVGGLDIDDCLADDG